jgi:oxygen-independent coproporphyrinogen-3 oxidase
MDLTQPYIADKQEVKPQDLPFEYLMNHFRLFEPCPKQPLFDLLGPTLIKQVEQKMAHCEEQEWITQSAKQWQITLLGHRYLNSLLTLFLAD